MSFVADAVGGERHDTGVAAPLLLLGEANCVSRRKSIHARHLQIHEDQIIIRIGCSAYGLVAIDGDIHNFGERCQHQGGDAAVDGVVFDDQHPLPTSTRRCSGRLVSGAVVERKDSGKCLLQSAAANRCTNDGGSATLCQLRASWQDSDDLRIVCMGNITGNKYCSGNLSGNDLDAQSRKTFDQGLVQSRIKTSQVSATSKKNLSLPG